MKPARPGHTRTRPETPFALGIRARVYRRDIEDLTAKMRLIHLSTRTHVPPGTQARLEKLRENLAEKLALVPAEDGSRKSFEPLVLMSLDPASIRALITPGAFNINPGDWNRIARFITPEIVDAFCASGCATYNLLQFGEGLEPLGEATLTRLVDTLQNPNRTFLTAMMLAPSEGHLSARLALHAARHWLARWPAPVARRTYPDSMQLCMTMLRLVAAMDGLPVDDWSPEGQSGFTKVLDLTRSAHGRLRLHALGLDLNALFTDPDAEITRIALRLEA